MKNLQAQLAKETFINAVTRIQKLLQKLDCPFYKKKLTNFGQKFLL